MRLLLVEDDSMIGETVGDSLRHEGYAVDWVRDGSTADTALLTTSYDLVLLDLGLPRMDGLSVLRSMRQRQDSTPVLIISARDTLEDRIAGLDTGADDYILKPFDLDELLARIRSNLRRSQGDGQRFYQQGSVRVDPVGKQVWVDGEPVTLSAKEWAVLEPLIARPGRVLSRLQLEDKLYAWKDDVSSNAVEVYIHGLRKKLGAGFIETIRGIGYRIKA